MIESSDYHFEQIYENKLYMPNNEAAQKAGAYLSDLMKTLDSSGGSIECVITHMPVGIGETVFDKLDANLAKAIMSIGAVKAFEIGDGVEAASTVGSKNNKNNDAFTAKNGKIEKETNHSGGILGGMSDGSPIILRAHIKPTPSISQQQHTVTKDAEPTSITIHGRHDPVIVPRAVVVVESMVAITLVDLLFQNMNSQMDGVVKFYES